MRDDDDPYHQPVHEEPPFEPVQKREHVPLNFNDPRLAFASKTSGQLLRNYAVLSVCQIKPVVRAPVLAAGQPHASRLCMRGRCELRNAALRRPSQQGWLMRTRGATC